ncbi:MAG: GNAT family N-acetyltransferase [DPANN group archaeon]|nr:GNAT family N-acetyltransferase [DPANN group archaeon]
MYITEIDKIPSGISHELAKATNSGEETVSKSINTDIQFGILRGHELVGFVSGTYFQDVISIAGLYIREDYRSKGLSTILLKCMMDKADK